MEPDFYFMFPAGLKHVSDMSREDLLKVIESLSGDADWWRKEARSRLDNPFLGARRSG